MKQLKKISIIIIFILILILIILLMFRWFIYKKTGTKFENIDKPNFDVQKNENMSVISIEESGLKFNSCHVPLTDDLYYDTYNKDYFKSDCIKVMQQFLEPESKVLGPSVIINGDFVYFISQEDADDGYGYLFTLKKGEATDMVKFSNELNAIFEKIGFRSADIQILKLLDEYIISESVNEVIELKGLYGADSPSLGLKILNNKVVWEFDNRGDEKNSFATIICDGIDLRKKYNLDGAFRLGFIKGKPAFIGMKNNEYFFVYNEKIIDNKFDDISLNWCCDSIPARWLGEELFFMGRIGDNGYNVVVSERNK